jgi:hypothetical protein
MRFAICGEDGTDDDLGMSYSYVYLIFQVCAVVSIPE